LDDELAKGKKKWKKKTLADKKLVLEQKQYDWLQEQSVVQTMFDSFFDVKVLEHFGSIVACDMFFANGDRFFSLSDPRAVASLGNIFLVKGQNDLVDVVGLDFYQPNPEYNLNNKWIPPMVQHLALLVDMAEDDRRHNVWEPLFDDVQSVIAKGIAIVELDAKLRAFDKAFLATVKRLKKVQSHFVAIQNRVSFLKSPPQYFLAYGPMNTVPRPSKTEQHHSEKGLLMSD